MTPYAPLPTARELCAADPRLLLSPTSHSKYGERCRRRVVQVLKKPRKMKRQQQQPKISSFFSKKPKTTAPAPAPAAAPPVVDLTAEDEAEPWRPR